MICKPGNDERILLTKKVSSTVFNSKFRFVVFGWKRESYYYFFINAYFARK